MVGVNFEMRGTGAFSGKLRNAIDGERVKKLVHRDGVEVQRSAKVYAPVDTGNLKRMIRNYIEENGYQNRITSEAEYAIDQELGTRNQSGTPHIKPAFDKVKYKFIEDMRGVIRQ